MKTQQNRRQFGKTKAPLAKVNTMSTASTLKSEDYFEWKNFDKIFLEAEFLHKKGKLSPEFVQVLKANNCWRNDEPYCSWEYFTYSMTDGQIMSIVNAFKKMKTA